MCNNIKLQQQLFCLWCRLIAIKLSVAPAWIYCVNMSTLSASSLEPPLGSSTETPVFTPTQQQWIQWLISLHSSIANELVVAILSDNTLITSVLTSSTSAGVPRNIGKWPHVLASNHYSWLSPPGDKFRE